MKNFLAVAALNLVVLAVLAVGSLVGLEVWLRMSIPHSSEESIFQYTQETPRWKVMRANARVQAYGSELRTNSLGFRDNRDAIPAKAPGELRVVVLGDSFTVSAGVDYERIFTSRIERMLRRAHPTARVINLGVAGYNIVQYEMVLKEVALSLKPDLIVVAVFPTNDFMNDTLEDNYRRAHGGAPVPQRSGGFKSLYAYQAYLGRAETKLRSLAAQALHRGGPAAAGPDPMVAAWDENIAALGRIGERARAERIPLVVTALPHTFHFTRQRELQGRLFRYCTQHGMDTANILEGFIASGVEESSLRLNPLDSHPNDAYNELAAQLLGAELEARLGAIVRPEQPARATPAALAR
jgi:hypothetical protein